MVANEHKKEKEEHHAHHAEKKPEHPAHAEHEKKPEHAEAKTEHHAEHETKAEHAEHPAHHAAPAHPAPEAVHHEAAHHPSPAGEHKAEKKTEKKPAEKKEKATKLAALKKKKSKKKGKMVVVVRGKRKSAVARASISEGTGKVTVNSMSLDAVPNRFIREIIAESLGIAGPAASKVDIHVNVRGGGVVGQAQAARNAIAVGLVKYYEDDMLKGRYLERDRYIIVEDARQIESKKYLGPKSRARKQKSYR